MTDRLAYESVYSFQERAHRHWCRFEAMLLATDAMMEQDLGAGAEVIVYARRRAAEKSHSQHDVRRALVAMASDDGREIVSFGHDGFGLVASVVYFPAAELTFDPIWVPRQCTQLFRELLKVLEQVELPFPTRAEVTAPPPR